MYRVNLNRRGKGEVATASAPSHPEAVALACAMVGEEGGVLLGRVKFHGGPADKQMPGYCGYACELGKGPRTVFAHVWHAEKQPAGAGG